MDPEHGVDPEALRGGDVEVGHLMNAEVRVGRGPAAAIAPDPRREQEPDVSQDVDQSLRGATIQPVSRFPGRDLLRDELQAQVLQVVAVQGARGLAAEGVEHGEQARVLVAELGRDVPGALGGVQALGLPDRGVPQRQPTAEVARAAARESLRACRAFPAPGCECWLRTFRA